MLDMLDRSMYHSKPTHLAYGEHTENTGVTADTVNDLRSGIYPEKRRTIHQMLFFVNTKSSNMHIGSDANNKL